MTDDPDVPAEDAFATSIRARADLLRPSMERVYAMLAASAVDDERWRAAVIAETGLWQEAREAASPTVPPGWEDLARRFGRMLLLLVAAGDTLRSAVERRDPALLGRAMGQLDRAEQAARATFAAAFALIDDTEPGP